MWIYQKTLQHPVNIKGKDITMAKFIVAQLGGPHGELGAAIRYLSQRFTMPTDKAKALLTDIGTEELAHVEMISTMLYQLLKGATAKEIKEAGLGAYYTDHGLGVYPSDVNGIPFTAATLSVSGNPITDLNEDLAAEAKAKATYQYLINLASDPDVKEALRFLRAREVVHYQRFGEALMNVYEYTDSKKMF